MNAVFNVLMLTSLYDQIMHQPDWIGNGRSKTLAMPNPALLNIAFAQFSPIFRFHQLQQCLVYRLSKRTVSFQGNADEIFIVGSWQNLHSTREVFFYLILQYLLV